jgi:ferredoxin-NADP reductase
MIRDHPMVGEETRNLTLTLRVRQITEEADGILSFVLVDPTGTKLPEWTPGAHVDLVLPSGTKRQYSLCGDPADRDRYRIAVRLTIHGRGGSVEVHRLRPGDLLTVTSVRNTFALLESESYQFVAAGIGITPILPMVRSAVNEGIPSTLLYVGREEQSLPFIEELTKLGADMTLVFTAAQGRPSWKNVLEEADPRAIYCCGPDSLMNELSEHVAAIGRGSLLRTERFTAAPIAAEESRSGQIRCARSRLTLATSPTQSYLETLREAGIEIDSSCEMGICGTCQVHVLSGEPDHRDSILTQGERNDGAFLPCVSRSSSKELTLDI